MNKENILKIERGFWHEGREYYEKHLAPEGIFVFPGMVLSKEDGTNGAEKAPRWDSLNISKERFIELADSALLLTYHAVGAREDESPYEGNITSVYIMKDSHPQLTFHQHTPDPK